MKGHVVAIVSLAAFCASAGEWQFFSAPAAPAMAAGEVRSDGAALTNRTERRPTTYRK